MKTRKKTQSKRDEKKTSPVDDSINELEELQHEELSGPQDKEPSAATSSTDEDEDEGLGDGNIGRSKNDIIGK